MAAYNMLTLKSLVCFAAMAVFSASALPIWGTIGTMRSAPMKSSTGPSGYAGFTNMPAARALDTTPKLTTPYTMEMEHGRIALPLSDARSEELYVNHFA
ncbi:hypothetical protein QBC37DRAFT_430652, partial [Rhypophila decipiens]